jgi:hypothetical protein
MTGGPGRPWMEPIAHWESALDSAVQSRWLAEHGTRVCQWAPTPFEASPTDCFQIDRTFWLWQAGVGGIRFRSDLPEFFAFPSSDADPAWFERVVLHSWLPAIYQVWGRQVLHASAVLREPGGEVIAFVGPSGAGKSTIAYSLGRRSGWRMVCDDTLAFSCDGPGIALYPLRQEVRLRPATSARYGRAGEVFEPIAWPQGPVTLGRLYFLAIDASLTRSSRIVPVAAAESYRLLLEQAFALSLDIPEHNRELMLDYAALAAVPSFRLVYRQSFDVIERVLDDLEAHALAVTDGPPG